MKSKQARKIVDEARSGKNPIDDLIQLALYHGNQLVRAYAIWELTDFASLKVYEVITNCFDETETIKVQIMAAKACGKLKIKGAVQKLVCGLNQSPDYRIVSAILRALAVIGDPSAIEPIKDFIFHQRQLFIGDLRLAAETIGILTLVEKGVNMPKDLDLYVLWN
jgi:HEAT repeat protein